MKNYLFLIKKKSLISKKIQAVKLKRANKINTAPEMTTISNEKAVSLYVSVEKNKVNSMDPLAGEYLEKVIFFGYLTVTQ